MQYRNAKFYDNVKEQLKADIMASCFPDPKPGLEPTIMDEKAVLATLRQQPVYLKMRLSEIMVGQALEELRADGSLLREDDGLAPTVVSDVKVQ